ncbi:MAG TPA: hypothetical protein VGK67_23355 [Myxococcales bacterium]|jgi:hypothetical protein
MRPRPLLRRSLPFFAALFLAAPAVWASVVLPTTVEALARRADLVVRGRAERSVAAASPDGKLIHTLTTVRVASALKGEAGEVVEVRTPGGTLGDITQVVHGAPSFSAGEEVVLFLHRESATRFTVENLALGKFEIVRAQDGAPMVRQRAAGLAVLNPDGKISPAQEIAPVGEREFLQRVRRAVEAARGER